MFQNVWMLLGGIAIIVALVSLLVAPKRKGAALPAGPWPYYARRPVTQAEQILYWRLLEALPNHIVLAQVQYSRFLGVKKGNNFRSWLNRVNRLSADFVVCAKDAKVVAVIELDDASHEKAERKRSDESKNRALAGAQIPLIRYRLGAMPDLAQIKKDVMANITIEADT